MLEFGKEIHSREESKNIAKNRSRFYVRYSVTIQWFYSKKLKSSTGIMKITMSVDAPKLVCPIFFFLKAPECSG